MHQVINCCSRSVAANQRADSCILMPAALLPGVHVQNIFTTADSDPDCQKLLTPGLLADFHTSNPTYGTSIYDQSGPIITKD